MYYFINYIACFTVFCSLSLVRCLVQLSPVENNDIAITETVIRETVNSLFATLRIRDVGHKPRLKDFSIIHNFFVSITLKDCKNLRRISQLVRVHSLNNNTLHIIAQINEVLNEGDQSTEAIDDINLNRLIEKFITKLRDLKKSYTFKRHFTNYSINAKILEHINGAGELFYNFSNRHFKPDDVNVVNSNEIWMPTNRSGRRIFESHRTRIKHYPFLASVHFFERFQCAGSIVQKDIIITAASCLQLAWNNRFFRENPAFLSVHVGTDYYEAGGEDIPVYEVYFHPEYTPKTLHNNLALMRLSKHLSFSKSNRNIRRVVIDHLASPLPSNTDGIIIVGWGAKDRTNTIYNPWINKISFAELDFYPLADCQEVYSKEFVNKKHFCAGYFTKGSGACKHDTGDPGISSGILVGVVSFGPPTCGTPDAPTVFTKVGFYKNWIDEVLKMEIPAINILSTLRERKTTIAGHYSDRTKEKIKITVESKQMTKAPFDKVFSKDTLRILQDDKLFKEFLSTMFATENENDLEMSSVDVTDSTKVKTKTNFGRKSKTKIATTTPNAILSDAEYDEIDLAGGRTKKNDRRIITTSIDTPLSAAYDPKNSVTDVNQVKPAYEYEDTEYYEAERKTYESTTKRVITRNKVNKMDQNKEKIKRPESKRTFPLSTPFIRFPNKDLKMLDIGKFMTEVKENTESKEIYQDVVEETENNNLNLDTRSQTKLTVSTTTSFLKLVDEEVYVSDDDYDGNENDNLSIEPNYSKIEQNKDTSNTIRTSNSADEDLNENDASTLEEDINNLLDELDLRKLLESDENSSGFLIETTKPIKQADKKIQRANVSKKQKTKNPIMKHTTITSYSKKQSKKGQKNILNKKKKIKQPKVKDTSLESYSLNENREDSRESDFGSLVSHNNITRFQIKKRQKQKIKTNQIASNSQDEN